MDLSWINLDKKWIALYVKKYLIDMELGIITNVISLISY